MKKNEYPFVTLIWLRKNLSSSRILIADCRWSLSDYDFGMQSYTWAHIPGAFFLSVDDDLAREVGEHGGRHPLPDVQKFEKKVNDIRVTQEKTGGMLRQ